MACPLLGGLSSFRVFTVAPSNSHYSASLDTEEWKTSILQPSLPYVLKMLTGLCHWHTKTQEALLSVVEELHSLEQIASDQHIGTLAENLLEAMMENTACEEEVRQGRETWSTVVWFTVHIKSCDIKLKQFAFH